MDNYWDKQIWTITDTNKQANMEKYWDKQTWTITDTKDKQT